MAAIAFFSPYIGGLALMSGHKTEHSSPKTAFTATKDGQTLQKTIATSGEVPRTATAESGSVMLASGDKPSAPNDTSRDTSKCDALTNKLMDTYKNQVKKEKESLDDILSPPITLPYTGTYVGDYNAKITALYAKHAEVAAAEHCTLPIGTPGLLDPATYSP